MKKHLRLFAIFAATVSLVGVMAGAALAADFSKSDVTVSETSLEIPYANGAKGTFTVGNKNAEEVASNLTVVTDADKVATVAIANASIPAGGESTVTVTAVAAGTANIQIKVGNEVAKTVKVTVTPVAPTFDSTGASNGFDFATPLSDTDKALYAGKKYLGTKAGKTIVIKYNSNRLTKKDTTYSATWTANDKKAPAFPATALKVTSADSDKKVTYTFQDFTAPAVTADTEYTLTITAKDGDEELSGSWTLPVYALPTITNDATKEPKAKIVWGDDKGWSFEVKGTNVDKFFIEKSTATANFGTTPATNWGIKFEDGAFTVDGAWKSTTTSTDFSWSGTEITKKVKVVAVRGAKKENPAEIGDYAASADKTFTFTFQGAAPKFSKAESSYTYPYSSTAITAPTADKPDNFIIVEAPGDITVAPDAASQKLLKALGLEFSSPQTAPVLADYTPNTFKAYYFSGIPNKSATKGTAITLTASNPYAKKTSKPTTFKTTVIINTDKVEFAANDKTNVNNATTGLTQNMLVKDKVDVTLTATPAPITWKATNLPAGVTLTQNPKDATQAFLKGAVTTPTKDLTSDKNHWTITATNSDFKDATAAVLSGDVLVWEKPTFKTDSKKAFAAKTGENGIKVSVLTNNPVVKKGWTVTLGGTALITAGAIQTNGFKFAAGNNANNAALAGTSEVKADADALNDKGILTLTGSFDRVPNGGKELEMPVTVAVPKRGTDSADVTNKTSATFKIKIAGEAPKFAKADWTIDDSDATSLTYTLEPTAGTPAITLTAEIDAATAKKVFNKSSAIKLSSTVDTTDTGLKFEDAAATAKDGKGKFTYTSGNSGRDVAFKKLPITVTASNKDVSAKDTTFKVTVTRDGTAPVWKFGGTALPTATKFYLADSTTPYALNVSFDEYSNKLNYNVKAGEAFDNTFVLKTVGSFPLSATVKPTDKNGIKATVDKVSDSDAHPTVKFTGTPSAVTKDTATKFTVEVTNPSTGKKAKTDVTFNILPKPTAAQTTITAKPVVYGKNVKVQPKLTATNKNVTWYLTGVGTTTNYTNTETSQTAAATALEGYGLAFDPAKGVISGTTSYATGKDSPLEVVMVASGDLAVSDPVTVKITVLGEPVKLTTKTVPFSVGENVSDVETTEALKVNTNLSDATEANRANVTWTVKSKPSEIKNLTLTPSTGTAAGVTATAAKGDNAKVTKKAQVEITFNNYGTETKGKLAFTVDGATPAIENPTMPTVKYGTTKTVNLKVTNPSVLSDKLKWKVTTKPSVKGVSASVKAGTGGKAVLTLKVGPKVEDSSASVGITVTDSLTKKSSEEGSYEFTITPYVKPEEKKAEAPLVADKPEAVTETKEDVASDKELGEGTVKLGNARTAEGLTSAQRAAIEDKGYVIAAVLPEVEVEDASGAYVLEVGELDEAAATGAELVYFAFASKPTTDDEYAIFANAEDGAETTVIPENRKVTVEAWLNVGTKYAPVIAVKANAAAAEAKTEEDVKAKAEEKAEEAKEESKEDSAKTETKEVKE